MVHWVGYGMLAGTMIVATIADCRTGKIPNRWTVSAILAGLILWTWAGSAGPSLLALACGLLPAAVLVMLGGMGGGDAKLIGAVGALTADWRFVVATVFYGFIVAALMGIVVMIRRRLVRRTMGRIAMTVMAIVGRVRPTMPDDSPRVPMAAALLAGTLVAALERFAVLTWPWTP